MIRHYLATDFETVASPGTALLRLPVNDFTYQMILLRYTESGSNVSVANMKTRITRIEILVDGTPVWAVSATQLFAINEHMGVAAVDGYLPLILAPAGLPGPAVQEALAWGTANIASLTVKVTIASGGTSPALEAYVSGRTESRALGKILQYEPLTLTPPASNAYFRLLNQEFAGRPILGFFAETTAITKVNYKVGQNSIFDEMPIAALDVFYNAQDRLSSVSGFSIVNFAATGQFGSDPMPIKANGVSLINQTAEFFVTSTSSFESVLALVGEARL